MEQLVEENGRLVRTNATPLLQFETGNVIPPSTRAITLTVANVGTGTARIVWFELAKDGVAQRNIREVIGYEPKASEQDYLPTSPVGGT